MIRRGIVRTFLGHELRDLRTNSRVVPLFFIFPILGIVFPVAIALLGPTMVTEAARDPGMMAVLKAATNVIEFQGLDMSEAMTRYMLRAVVAFYLTVVNGFGLLPIQKVCACVAFLAFGYYAPNVYITNVAQKRRESIVAAFPDALDLLLICVESGMSIEAAIQKVGAEVGSSSMELAEELSLLTAELSYLPDRRLAYEGLARRTNHPGIKSVATAMIQAERYGTPLGTALRVMAKENRDLRLAAAEKKAAALPAQLTVPMILFFLPVLFVVILGPAMINISDTMAKDKARASEVAASNSDQ